jgi:hypothetical protein
LETSWAVLDVGKTHRAGGIDQQIVVSIRRQTRGLPKNRLKKHRDQRCQREDAKREKRGIALIAQCGEHGDVKDDGQDGELDESPEEANKGIMKKRDGEDEQEKPGGAGDEGDDEIFTEVGSPDSGFEGEEAGDGRRRDADAHPPVGPGLAKDFDGGCHRGIVSLIHCVNAT